jgi:ketosteroid isomerase-like protein
VHLLLALLLLQGAAAPGAKPATAALAEDVRRTERAFAKTMADRDHAAFTSFLAEDTIFVGRETLRGRDAVARAWKRFYDGGPAPFSWEPERVEVNDAGTLGVSFGPVRGPDGRPSGQYNSIWRREPDGKWKIVFDHGCNCAAMEHPSAPAPASMPKPAP